MALSRSSRFLVGAFAVSGALHVAKPEVYEPLMPSWVPAHGEVILASGVAELACALGMALQVPMIRAAVAAARSAD